MNEYQSPAERYREAARRHGAATESGDYESANSAYDQLMHSLEELQAIPDGLLALHRLLEDQNASVRCWAATHLLPTSPTRAAEVLEALSRETGVFAFDARQVLKEWRSTKLPH